MLIECVANVSEGRRLDVVAALAEAVRQHEHVRLLDVSADVSHNRTVLTFAGGPEALRSATLALFERAVAAIDLRAHRGEHPRIGAVDVVPFVPLADTPMSACVELARAVGMAVAARHGVPVFLYEEAAIRPARRRLEDIRRGGFEGLADKMRDPDWAPDYGPAAPHPTAGASVIGAKYPLIAFNITLATDRLDVARAIAAAIRTRGGGLPCLKALGLRLAHRGIVQVSMNLTDYRVTGLSVVFDRVREEAATRGVDLLDSEIVGLVPEAALQGIDPEAILLVAFSRRQVLERQLEHAGLLSA